MGSKGGGGGNNAANPIVFQGGGAQDQFAQAESGINVFQNTLGDILPNFFNADFGNVNTTQQQNQIGAAIDNIGTSAAGVGESIDAVNQSAQGISTDIDAARASAAGLSSDANALRGLASQSQAIASGNDPRFAEFRDAQLAQSEQQRSDQTAEQDAQAQRGGFAGGSAAANQQARLDRQFNLDQSSLSSQIGLQQLGRQDAARAQAGGLFGQAAGVQGLQGQLNLGAGGLGATQANAFGLGGQLGIGQGQLFGQQGQLSGLQGNLANQTGALNAQFTQQGLDAQTAGLQALLGSAGLDIGLLASILPFTQGLVPGGGGGGGERPADTVTTGQQ